MSSMREQFVQRLTADLLADDLLRLRASLQKPAAMAADGLAFARAAASPTDHPGGGIPRSVCASAGSMLPAGCAVAGGGRNSADGYTVHTWSGWLGLARTRLRVSVSLRGGKEAQLGKLSIRVS